MAGSGTSAATRTATGATNAAVGGARGGPADAALLHVLDRLTFGPTRAELDRLAALGFDAWFDDQLRPVDADDPEVTRRVATFETETLPAQQIRQRFHNQLGGPAAPREQLQLATLVRATHSRWQVRERLVELWSDHFTIDVRVGHEWFLLPVHHRDVIRPHALGRFADLLAAVAHSPAMLHYLDNWLSRRDHPNENYARELLELHTVGVHGGYDEHDVATVARLLTGWSYQTAEGPDRFTFRFKPAWHDAGGVDVLGFTRSGTGYEDGAAFVDHLAHHPATARFVATKLARRFIADAPSGEVIERLAQVYLTNDTSIAAVLRALVAEPEFWSSATAKTRRPVDVLAAALRSLDADIDTTDRSAAGRQLTWRLRSAGHAPFEWPTPDGYPDAADAWLHTNGLLTRWNLVADLAYGRVRQVRIPWELLALDEPRDGLGFVRHWFEVARHRAPTDAQGAALLAGAGLSAGSQLSDKQARATRAVVVTLSLCEPGAQRR